MLVWLAIAAVLLLGAGGCSLGGPELQPVGSVAEAGLPCSEATAAARRALGKLGYEVVDVQPAQPGTPGKVVGRRNTGWKLQTPEPGADYETIIVVRCSDRGAEFEASSSETLFDRRNLKKELGPALTASAQQRVQRPRIPERVEQGMVIEMTPLRGSEAVAEFGADLLGAGILPVKVEIKNRTGRSYAFRGAQIEMISQEGERRRPLTESNLVAKQPPVILVRLREKLIADGDLAAGAEHGGYLYFEAAAYRRARVTLLDKETEETEGFAVEF